MASVKNEIDPLYFLLLFDSSNKQNKIQATTEQEQFNTLPLLVFPSFFGQNCIIIIIIIIVIEILNRSRMTLSLSIRSSQL